MDATTNVKTLTLALVMHDENGNMFPLRKPPSRGWL